jgi:tRNA A37 threonylcarbamoyladenosine dehydratase
MAVVRKKLRQDYGFSRSSNRSWHIPCGFSPEPVVYPDSMGRVCEAKPESSELKLDCESGFGTASFLTGTFGFQAVAKAIELILNRVS